MDDKKAREIYKVCQKEYENIQQCINQKTSMKADEILAKCEPLYHEFGLCSSKVVNTN